MLLDHTPEAENSLIMEAKQGNRNAYGELARRHYDGVVRMVYHLCGEAQIAEDAAQEAFIRAWVKLPTFQPRSPFRNWLYRIAMNAALDILRRKREKSIEDEEMLILAETKPGPEAAYIEKERVEQLRGAVNSLPEAARSVLVLREYGELSYEEIASVLEIPIGTVMSRLNYARNRLRGILQRNWLEMEVEHA